MTSNSRNRALAAVLIALAAASPAAADDAPKGAPTKEALARRTALKLAGLATFVATSCRDLRLDSERFKSAVTALGLPPKDLEDKTTQFAYLEYTMTYKKDVKANCARARTEFGPGGKTLPNLFTVVGAPLAPSAPASPGAPDGKKP